MLRSTACRVGSTIIDFPGIVNEIGFGQVTMNVVAHGFSAPGRAVAELADVTGAERGVLALRLGVGLDLGEAYLSTRLAVDINI